MFQILGFALAAALILYGYTAARSFVRTRLRFVDAALGRGAPILAGLGAFLVSLPVFGLLPLPFFGLGTSLVLGFSIGAGVKAGAREVRDGTPAGYISGR